VVAEGEAGLAGADDEDVERVVVGVHGVSWEAYGR
jgi:hypothetical protein